MRLPRSGPLAALLVALPLAGAALGAGLLAAAPSASVDGEAPPAQGPGEAGPLVYAALGDSITAAAGARGLGESRASSWATGSNATDGVLSIAERLAASGGPVRAENLAKSGARAGDLERQARVAALAGADLVTVLVGANDACARGDLDEPAFRRAISRALDALPRDAAVVVLAVPDVAHLASLRASDAGAFAQWTAFRVCPAILAPDLSPAARLEAASRVATLNGILAEEAARAGATFARDTGTSGWGLAEVSTWDFFHPSLRGQARLADAAWPAVERALAR